MKIKIISIPTVRQSNIYPINVSEVYLLSRAREIVSKYIILKLLILLMFTAVYSNEPHAFV